MADKFCYSNNGLSYRMVADTYTPVAGEVLFDDMPDSGALTAAFPGYTAALAAQNAVIAAITALAGGINLTSTGTPALDANYSTTSESVSNVANVTTYILKNNKFPGGTLSMPWLDSTGNAHVFPDLTTFENFATAFGDFVAACQFYKDSGGTIGAIPSSNITIP